MLGYATRPTLFVVSLVAALAIGSAHGGDAEGKTAPTAGVSASGLVRNVWLGLGGFPNACPDEFDYFPGGGMRIFACHVFSACPYGQLHQLAGRKVFLSGPHTHERLVLNSSNEFGHYNPEFVQWAHDQLIPGATDENFRKQTQGIYDRYVQQRAFLFDATYRKAVAEPDCWRSEVERYRSLLESGQLPEYDYERYFFFMNEGFCSHSDTGFDYFYDHGFDGGYDGNVVKTCVAFWIRRSLDGTADQFYKGLQKLRRTYEGANPSTTIDE